jgi:hypothetical protein
MLMYTSIIRSSGVIGLNTINHESTPTHIFNVIIHNATVFENLQIETVYGSAKAYQWSRSLTDKWTVGNPYCCQFASGRLEDDSSDDEEWEEAKSELGKLQAPIIDCGSFAYKLRNMLLLAAKFPFKAATLGLAWGSPPIIVLAFNQLATSLGLNGEQLDFYLIACGFVEAFAIDVGPIDRSVIDFLFAVVQEDIHLYFHESLVLTPSTVVDDGENPKRVISRLSERSSKQFITQNEVLIYRAELDKCAYVIPDNSKLERWHPHEADEEES